MIGVAVREFGTVVGVVVFGIGGLIRFRSATDSTRDTVRLIVVTLVGLTAGLGLLLFAVIITLFTFTLIYVFDTRPPHRIRVEGMGKDRTGSCAEVYRTILKGHGCRIIAEHHSLEKARVEFVFRCPAAAPATSWTRSCAASPRICAAKWIGKSASLRARRQGRPGMRGSVSGTGHCPSLCLPDCRHRR